ncbi:hypothetical protein D3C81_2170510 [compost metagenome]
MIMDEASPGGSVQLMVDQISASEIYVFCMSFAVRRSKENLPVLSRFYLVRVTFIAEKWHWNTLCVA